MFLSKLSINRPVLVTVILIIFVMFGAMAYFTLPLNLMPSADIPFTTIQTVYPGAGPAEIETQITKKIEDAVSTVSKIDYIDSYSMDNVSIILIAFEIDKDIDVAMSEVKQKVDAISMNLPSDAEMPSVDKFDPSTQPIMQLILTGNLSGLELFDIADKQLKDRFSQIEGVAKVDITGGQEREIQVDFEDRVVLQNRVSLAQVAQILAASNMNMPAGQFQQSSQEYSVRMEGEFDKVEQMNNLDIPTAFGTKKLRQLAEVRDTGKEVRKRSIYFNNKDKVRKDNVVQLSITKTSQGNPVAIADNVKETMKNIQKSLPEGTELTIINDDTDYIRSTVDDTLMNVLLGIVFTGIVLLFFLHDLRSTLIVAVAMPVSIVSTFMLMDWAGFSLNMLSLMGISTAVGVLVTNSVVVLENIFRHKEMGHNRRVAANKGTGEIAVAVIASTLTNIVVFVPLAMMNTIIGQFMKEFALTVAFATIFSLVVSFTVTPMLASLILPEKKKKNPIGNKFEAMFHHWERIYKGSLSLVLKNKGMAFVTVVLAFGLFIATMMFVAPQLGFELFPATDEGQISVNIELPVGYNLDETAAMYKKVEEIATAHKEVESSIVKLGSLGDLDEAVNLAAMTVNLVPIIERDISTQDLVDILIKELSVLPNAKFKVSPKSSMGAGGSPIEFYLQGTDIEKLNALSTEFIEKAKSVKGLINFDSNLKAGKPEITLIPKRKELAAAGLTAYDVAMTLRASVEGVTSTKFRDAGEEYDVVISLNDSSVRSPEDVKNIPLVSPYGTYRLSQLADVTFTEGATKIVHRDKIKSAKFTGGIGQGAAQGEIINNLTKIQKEMDLPEGYRVVIGGESEMMQENVREMGKAFMIAVILTYLLLAAILESFAKPLIILVTIPLALIGVIFSLYLTNINMGMIVMLGIVMLIGIVVNAAILLLDYTEQLRRTGKTNKDALMEACPTKLKPILMSSIAIIFGMLPMALGVGESGAEMRMPLGIVSIGGIIVSTFMTLYVMPALYYLTTRRDMKAVEKV
jgi:HAE1 family hydrophobic/amphiphilic exporter-1